jgi:hypothetical protein
MRPLDDAPDTAELLPDLLAGKLARTDRAKVTDALDAIDGALTDNIRPLTGAAAMSDKMLGHYSDALDEIYRLRQLLAYEAQCVSATLEMKTFPKSRRDVHERQIERMRAAARGEAEVRMAGMSNTVLRYCLRDAGAAETLTRSQWEESA